jgi:hypothetical protein
VGRCGFNLAREAKNEAKAMTLPKALTFWWGRWIRPGEAKNEAAAFIAGIEPKPKLPPRWPKRWVWIKTTKINLKTVERSTKTTWWGQNEAKKEEMRQKSYFQNREILSNIHLFL